MNRLTREQFASLVKQLRTSKRLAGELRFAPEYIENWTALDVIAVGTRSGAEGLLIIQTDSFYAVPYALTTGVKDSATGRSKPITCDFCYTWQQGGKAGRITFKRAADGHLFTFLCCGDLQCSLHVRNMTPEATLSRTQLHEDITVEQRIARLKQKMDGVMTILDAQPTALHAGA